MEEGYEDEPNHEINFFDYVRNYTFATISGVSVASCIVYGVVKEKPSAILAGGGILFMMSWRGLYGYINLRKMKKGSDKILELESENEELRTENKELKRRLELKLK